MQKLLQKLERSTESAEDCAERYAINYKVYHIVLNNPSFHIFLKNEFPFIDLTELRTLKNTIKRQFSNLEEDPEECSQGNPDCSDFFTQQTCKNYCGLSEGM